MFNKFISSCSANIITVGEVKAFTSRNNATGGERGSMTIIVVLDYNKIHSKLTDIDGRS